MRAIAAERTGPGARSGTPARARRAAIVVVLAMSALAVDARAGEISAGEAEAAKIFVQRCTACHTFGKGVKVGPDLKGVTARRPRHWLLRFIRSSQAMIDSGDPVAVSLFEEFRRQRMPDWTDLSDEQVGAILDWLAADGPDRRPADERSAELATTAEVELGRSLFLGQIRFAGGGMACAGCHAIRDGGESRGGSLASDLTGTYAAYRDRALTSFIRRPCTPRLPESSSAGFLRPQELFALKAYLRRVGLDDRAAVPAAAALSSGKAVEWQAPRRPLPAPPTAAQVRGERLFAVMPYAALLVLAIGMGLRHALCRRRRVRLDAEARTAWRLFTGSTLWRIGLAATAAAHVAGLLLPEAIASWNGAPLRLHLLEGAGFLFGILALIGWIRIMSRHLGRTASSTAARIAELADNAFVSLLFVAIASGLLSAAMYRWGSIWAGGTLAPYLSTVLYGAPAAALAAQLPYLVKLHVFSLFALLAVLPATSAALIPIAAVDRAMVLAARPIAAAARRARSALGRMSPARFIWPEEDLDELPVEPDAESPPRTR
jgi:nitrate reductase gamma subunit